MVLILKIKLHANLQNILQNFDVIYAMDKQNYYDIIQCLMSLIQSEINS